MRLVILTGLLPYPLYKATDLLSINYASAIEPSWWCSLQSILPLMLVLGFTLLKGVCVYVCVLPSSLKYFSIVECKGMIILYHALHSTYVQNNNTCCKHFTFFLSIMIISKGRSTKLCSFLPNYENSYKISLLFFPAYYNEILTLLCQESDLMHQLTEA